MTNYYAHSGESLNDHLEKVSALAGYYGRDIGSEKVCELIGKLHDVGKATESFQDVLNGKASKIDHAIVGAMIWNDFNFNGRNLNKCENGILHNMISMAIAGHHSSLYKGIFELNTLLSRNKSPFRSISENDETIITIDGKTCAVKNISEYKIVEEYVRQQGFLNDISKTDFNCFGKNETCASYMLFQRLIFSCLIDADYTATSTYYDNPAITKEELLAGEKEADFNPEVLLNKLNEYYRKINTSPEQPINKLRASVYQDASKAGKKLNTGFYTMTAPTGTGKTLALIKFALEQAKRNNQSRIFVVLPYLSIISQSVKIYKEIFGKEMVLEDDSNERFNESTRELSDRWKAPIIVTTSVKFFETLHESTAPALRKLHRVANSVVVFDESQTLPTNLTSVTLRTLDAFAKNFNTTILFSTATQMNYKFRENLEIETHEIINNITDLYSKYGKIKNTNVVFNTQNIFTTKDIARKYENEHQVLYVVNTTNKAKRLYQELISKHDKNDVFLLTSQFLPAHKRYIIEKEVGSRMQNNRACHLVSTQCIEAGVDIDFPIGCREFAPYLSIIQTAGRINRNGKHTGNMLIFSLDDNTLPGLLYKNQTNMCINMAREYSELDLNKIKYMDIYSRKVFASDEGRDDIKIQEAENKLDFQELNKLYKLIEDKTQITILIPLDEQLERVLRLYLPELLINEYKTLFQKVSAIGKITKKELSIAKYFSVSVMSSKTINSFLSVHCHPLRLYRNDAYIPWYIADIDKIYDIKKGICFTENEGGIFV